MSIRVRIPTPLRAATNGEAELTSSAATVVGLIEDLEQRYPDIRGRLRDDSGEPTCTDPEVTSEFFFRALVRSSGRAG